jgi:hypothetical protein
MKYGRTQDDMADIILAESKMHLIFSHRKSGKNSLNVYILFKQKMEQRLFLEFVMHSE